MIKTEKELIGRRNKQFKYGILLTVCSVPFIPGLVFKLVYLSLESFRENAAAWMIDWYQTNKAVEFFFNITPNISLDSFTFRDLVASIIIMAFLWELFH